MFAWPCDASTRMHRPVSGPGARLLTSRPDASDMHQVGPALRRRPRKALGDSVRSMISDEGQTLPWRAAAHAGLVGTRLPGLGIEPSGIDA